MIPFARGMYDSSRRLVQIVVGACRCGLQLAVFVTGIVEDLHLRRGLPYSIGLFGGAIKDSAVPFRRDFPVECEIEVPELADSDYVTRATVGPDKRAVDDFPSVGDGGLAKVAPSRCCFPVEKKSPALSFFAG